MNRGKVVFFIGTLYGVLINLNLALLFLNGIMWQRVSGIELMLQIDSSWLFLLILSSLPGGFVSLAVCSTGLKSVSSLIGEVSGAFVGLIVGSFLTTSGIGLMYSFTIGLYEVGFAILGCFVSTLISDALEIKDRY